MLNTRREKRFRPSLHFALGAVTCVLGSTAAPISAQGASPPAIQLRGVESLGIGATPSKADMAKAGADLLALHAEYQAHVNQPSGQEKTGTDLFSARGAGASRRDPRSHADPGSPGTTKDSQR